MHDMHKIKEKKITGHQNYSLSFEWEKSPVFLFSFFVILSQTHNAERMEFTLIQ